MSETLASIAFRFVSGSGGVDTLACCLAVFTFVACFGFFFFVVDVRLPVDFLRLAGFFLTALLFVDFFLTTFFFAVFVVEGFLAGFLRTDFVLTAVFFVDVFFFAID